MEHALHVAVDLLVWWWAHIASAALNTIEAIGQSPGGLAFTALLVAYGFWNAVKGRGWREAWAHAWQSFKSVALPPLILGVVVFLCFVAKAPYDTYKRKADIVSGEPGRIATAKDNGMKEAEALAGESRRKLEDEIASLKSQGPKIVTKTVPEPRHCWLARDSIHPSSAVVGAKFADEAVIFCNAPTRAPYAVLVKFNAPVLQVSFSPANGSGCAMSGQRYSADRKSASVRVDWPSLDAHGVLFVQAHSSEGIEFVGAELAPWP